MSLARGIPRFNLRQLLWLVVVAAVGCLWWAPSRTDTTVVQYAIGLDLPERPQVRFTMPEEFSSALGETWPSTINAAQRDLVFLRGIVGRTPLWQFHNGSEVHLRNRFAGRVVLAVDVPNYDVWSELNVAKNARIYVVSRAAANLIDGAFAAALIALIATGLWFARFKTSKR